MDVTFKNTMHLTIELGGREDEGVDGICKDVNAHL